MKKSNRKNKTKKSTPKKRTLSPEQLEKRTKSFFKKKIVKTFTDAGFHYVPTNDQEMYIGLRKVEVDALFIYENVWLICEDTVKTTNIRDHIRTKNEAFGQIKGNLSCFVAELIKRFPDKADELQKYDCKRIKAFALYMSKEEVVLSDDDYKLFPELIFVQPNTLNYFQWIPQSADMKDIAQLLEQSGFTVMYVEANRISLNKGYTENGFADKVYHIHLRYAGDNDELYFRDYLNEHPAVAKEYETLKLRLWKQYEHDRDAYTDAKTDFISKWTAEARKEYGDRY